jgi:predicted hotdog family 3-hydroxylacyl-ACP dehydratase/3-hydroxymyristoyl/3-hydroxydecanoyl-(acyl carrier protein) dehydratase
LGATEPVLSDVTRTSDGLRVEGHVPEELVYFEGHFPGQPVVPGVVLLHWALGLARRELDLRAAPGALEAVKFQRSLLPGESFALALVPGPERIDWRYTREQEPVASGRARFEGSPAAHEPVTREAWPETGPPLRLPYAGAMRLVDRVLAQDGPVTLCGATVRPDTPLCDGTAAPSWLALEWLGQGMAAAGGARRPDDAPPVLGLLASARRITLRTDRFRVGERLWIRAEHLRGERGAVAFACALGVGALPTGRAQAEAGALAHGALTAFVA